MPNTDTYNTFFNLFKQSIIDKTFAKLTLAKTIGNTQLMNIYIRTILIDDELKLSLTFKYQTEEEIFIHTINEAIPLLIPYLNSPFLSALMRAFVSVSGTCLSNTKIFINLLNVGLILK